MTEVIVAALIGLMGSIISVVAVVVTSNRNAAEVDAKLDKAQAVQETKIEELTREVRQHNSFATKIPVIEERIKMLEDKIKDLK